MFVLGASRDYRKALGPLELELKMEKNHVGSGNWTQILCKNRTLSHISIPNFSVLLVIWEVITKDFCLILKFSVVFLLDCNSSLWSKYKLFTQKYFILIWLSSTCLLLFICFVTGTGHVSQDGFKFMVILLSQPSESQD